tara:strand:- start:86 stop:727 length:642 start_codon:yes stop_codon:yes gene_type:complete
MFSVVIPTMWSIPHYTNALIRNYVKSELITEIIIIDNNHSEYKHVDIYNHEKVKIHVMDKNIFVNPAWNLGVELSENNNVIISNDDIVIKPDQMLDFLIKNDTWDCIGIDTSSYTETNTEFELKELSRSNKLNDLISVPYGFGCLMVIKRDSWITIPNNIKIYFGDNWIVNTYKNVFSIKTIDKLKTKMASTSSNPIFKAIKDSDNSNFLKQI